LSTTYSLRKDGFLDELPFLQYGIHSDHYHED